MMNPYTAPAVSAETENRTNPAFRIIGPYGKVMIFVLVIMFLALGTIVVCQILLSSRRIAMFYAPVAGSMIGMLSPLITLIIASRHSRVIRQHPIVRSGQALVAGLVYEGPFSRVTDYLFLTPAELVCFHRGGGFAAGKEQRIRLIDISEVCRPRRFGIPQMAIEVHFRWGRSRRWTVSQPREWLKAIRYELPTVE